MPIKFAAALLASIGLCAKSSYDAKKKANSPEAQMRRDEFEYLYGALPRRKGYNRVLEFDLIHKKIRDDLPVIAREMDAEIRRWILYVVTAYGIRYEYPCPREWQMEFKRRHELNDQAYWTSEVNWLQYLREQGVDPDDWLEIVEKPVEEPIPVPREYQYLQQLEALHLDPMREHGGAFAEDYRALQEWRRRKKKIRVTQEQYDTMYRNAVLGMKNEWGWKTHHGFLDYKTYVLEYARRSAYEAGYMPLCQPIGRHRRIGPANSLYDGSIEGNHWKIDWDNGIPDQEQRAVLAEADKTHPTTWVHGDSHFNMN